MTSAVNSKTSQLVSLMATHPNTTPFVQQMVMLAADRPPQAHFAFSTELSGLIARSGGSSSGANGVVAQVSQLVGMFAYKDAPPVNPRQIAWTFVFDGHRFYVLDLGPEGTWAYDMTTQEWCQLQTQGFYGWNFTHGAMWGSRIMGGDSLYSNLLELDPNQFLDEGWREVKHMVTGGIPSRSRARIGVANFTLTASVGDDNAIDQPISLAFSDDNGVSWSQEFDEPLTDMGAQMLLWNALGSFQAPGRVFRITDYSGPIRLDGADVVLTLGTGADSGIDQDGQRAQ